MLHGAGILTYMWVMFGANVGSYSIHGTSGDRRSILLMHTWNGVPMKPEKLIGKACQGHFTNYCQIADSHVSRIGYIMSHRSVISKKRNTLMFISCFQCFQCFRVVACSGSNFAKNPFFVAQILQSSPIFPGRFALGVRGPRDTSRGVPGTQICGWQPFV